VDKEEIKKSGFNPGYQAIAQENKKY